MAISVLNLTDNPNVSVVDAKGPFTVAAFRFGMNVSIDNAIQEYYASRMNTQRRQLVCDLSVDSINIQKGIIQYMIGKVSKGEESNEVVPIVEYSGKGAIVTKPTLNHLVLVDVNEWNNGIVVDNNAYYASASNLKQKLILNYSPTIAECRDTYSLCFEGDGFVCLELKTPYEALVCVDMQDDVLRTNGRYAVAWSEGLTFTTEHTSRYLMDSPNTDDNFINTFKGTGKVLMTAF